MLSCSNLSREDNVAVLKKELEKTPQQNIEFVDSKPFFKLLEAVPDDEVRRDGVQKINVLTSKYWKIKNHKTKTLPLNEIEFLFDSLIENHPLKTHDKMLFELSKVYELLEKPPAALKALNKLLSLYPAITYIDAVQFHKANVLYAQGQFAQAEKFYKQMLVFRRSIYYEQAVYKQGWTQFMQANYAGALSSFMHLLDLHSRDSDLIFKRMKPAEVEFIEKVMQAINQCFEAMMGPVSARNYFVKKQKRKYEYHVFLSLAEYYKQQNKFSDAVKTYRLFVAMNELHIQSPVLLLKVMSLYKKAKFDNEFLIAQKDFVLRYPVQHIYWRLHPKSQTTKTFKALKKNIEQLANRYYFLSKNSGRAVDYRQSQRWNRLFLYSFENDVKTRNIRLQLAESLQGDRQFGLAALQYESVAYDYNKHPGSSKAAYAALLMHERNDEKLTGFEKKYAHKLYLDSVHRFLAMFPEYAKTKNVKSGVMRSRYTNDDYDVAFKLFGQRKWQQAAVAFESLRNNTVQQKLQIEITKKLALIYLQIAQFEKAISELQKISYYVDANNRQHDALWLAAELSELNDNVKQAIELYSLYIERFAYPLQRSIEARQRLVKIYDRIKKPQLAIQWRAQLINADANGGKFRTQETRYLAAQARFVLAESLEDNYRKTSLIAPLSESIKIKSQLLNDASNAYKIAAAYKVAQVVTPATYRMAELNENFYQAIVHSVRPDNLNEFEQKQYNVLLNEKAQRFKDKAIRFHQVNVSRKADGLNDGWILKSADRLQELISRN